MRASSFPHLLRAQRAIARGLAGCGKRVPHFTDPTPAADARASDLEERRLRAHLEVLDGGRELLRIADEFERKAELARLAGVEALRHAGPGESWAQIGERLGITAQGAHKRYRDVDGPEAELTFDDELAHRELDEPVTLTAAAAR